ncbi:MAG TPA: cytochrome c maturation protein CcmE [Rhizomicrobium sp.]|nr:cytochrome c maturation protein CcmE [Rhizomicrobium sp.]
MDRASAHPYSPRANDLTLLMNPRKRRRLYFAAALVVAGAGGAALVLGALNDNVLYFYSPSDIRQKHVQPGVDFRVGGLVEKGSVTHGPHADVHFVVTDGRASVPVDFHGVLPDLFREGQGIVAMGALDDKGTFVASQVLAKHDEKYMPPEVVDALKRSGRWKEGGT